MAVKSRYLQSSQKTINFDQKHLFSTIFGPFWGLLNALVTNIGLKRCSNIPKLSLKLWGQLMFFSIWSKKHKFWSKTTLKVNNTKNLYQYIFPLILLFFQLERKKIIKGLLQISRWSFCLIQIWLKCTLCGCFPRPKKYYFRPKSVFGTFCNFFLRSSTLIICYFCHF